jgi:adenine-specific DNA-methyltransferase
MGRKKANDKPAKSKANRPPKTPKAKKPKPAAEPTPVKSVKHTAQTRSNIPTREQGNMVAADEAAPKRILYPRDTSLDPQLVWKGKDEQDAAGLDVPVVPIYIQEKIHSQALIEDLRSRAKAGQPDDFPLFGDFNGLETDLAKRTEFYRHEQHWTNRFILGDSLYVMASLAEKERLKGQVQCIYFDPPYGIKFGSNWQVSTRKRDVKDAKADDLTRQPEQIKAFRDTWQLGIHSYLTYLRDRLTVARDLLTESGSLFLQIGDENVHLVRNLLDEVFGVDNLCSQIVFRKTTGKGSQLLDNTYDTVHWVAKNRSVVKYRPLFEPRSVADDDNLRFVELPDGARRRMTSAEVSGVTPAPNGSRFYRPNPLTNQRPAQGNDLREYLFEGKRYTPGGGTFRTDKPGLDRLNRAGRLLGVGSTLTFLRYLDDFAYKPRNDIWDDTRSSGYGEERSTSFKPTQR